MIGSSEGRDIESVRERGRPKLRNSGGRFSPRKGKRESA